jgi:hypothetical protein
MLLVLWCYIFSIESVKMVVRDQACKQCGVLNCSRHTNIINSITQRLTDLLEYFESPDEDMRTFIQPEKTKSATTSRPDILNGGSSKDSSFSDAALKQMGEVEKVTPMPQSSAVTERAIVHVGSAASSIPESRTATASNHSANDGIPRLGHGKGYKAHERHHFVRVNNTSFTSCASPTGAYSEIALVLWVDSKPYQKYSSSTDRYRVVISLMHDAEDDLWSISAKLLKRASYYNNKDEEEGQISNRLCITSEIRSEVKKMLLFLGISPREAYKMFRRNMEEKFVISASDYGFTTVESTSHCKLMKELEKPSTTNPHWDAHGTGYYGSYPHNLHPRHRMRERDARESMADHYTDAYGMD